MTSIPRRTPFTQGPRLTGGPSGDPAAQAVASLRGYAYQLYASGLAWLRLKPGEELHLEVAKDYAVAAEDALRGVEIKDTTANVTINSEDVRETLDGFVDLVERNRERKVNLHFLSTSKIGLERAVEDRANGEPTLSYWRRAAAGADIDPLRTILSRANMSARVRAFIDARDNDALRDEFLSRIHWDCGQPDLQGLIEELSAGLVHYCANKLKISAQKEQLTAAVLQRVLGTVVQPRATERRLIDADLTDLAVEATNVLVSRQDFEALLRQLSGGLPQGQEGAALQTADASGILEPERDIPVPLILAGRSTLISNVLATARQSGIAILTGSTGMGKTMIARLTARHQGGAWSVLDLRELSAEETARRLDVALGMIGAADVDGIILDDLNELEEPAVRRSFARILATLHRRDALSIVTCYREPSARAVSELGLSRDTHITVPDLTQGEVGEMVAAAGGDPAQWTNVVYMSGSFGHPQMVQAVISGLRMRGWPREEITSLNALDASSDVEVERLAARRLWDRVLPSAATKFLYRTSLLIGRFDRTFCIGVAPSSRRSNNPARSLICLSAPGLSPPGGTGSGCLHCCKAQAMTS